MSDRGEISTTVKELLFLISISLCATVGYSSDTVGCGGDPNAVSGCGNHCGNSCSDYNKTIACPLFCLLDGCDCKIGYLFDDIVKKCVKKEDCTPQCNGPHEKYIDCLTGQCIPKTCDDLGMPIPCPRVKPSCSGGCICEDGFVRNCQGICIKKEDCPSCGGDFNAVSGCGNNCGNSCSDYDKPVPCPLFCLSNGCDCRPGFVYDAEVKKCVKKEDCCCVQPLPKCPKNEVAVKEKFSCPPDTCDTLWLAYDCAPDPKPQPGCTCAKGYLRTNSTGVCIPESRCLPPECADDPNAKRGCGNRCKKTCADYKDTNKKCPKICHLAGCDCKDGYIYDDFVKKCVKPEDCTPQCTGPHEKYHECPLGLCEAKTCEQLGKPIPCPSILAPCPGGCVCEDGYLRKSDGVCIKKEECPSQCESNSHFTDCADPCPATCAHTLPQPCKMMCQPGCQCNDGHVRNINNECVKIEKCPDQAGCSPNQTWVSCNVNCPDAYCPKDDKPTPVCDAPKHCPGGCHCKINYRLNNEGKCIYASECPPVKCTRPNEVWDSCPSGCLAENCEDIDNQPTTCNTLILNCQPRCVCAKGHFRKDGICVPAKECPRKCKDPNATWKDCPNGPDPCPATCQHTLPKPSNLPCKSGCQCNEGYVLSVPDGICVKIENCKDQAGCSPNQTWVTCNVNCPDAYCPKNDQPTPICDPPYPCPGGCHCKINHRLNNEGKCIYASECPPVKCTRPNEVWDSCPSACLAENCDDIDNQPTTCNTLIFNCQPRCVCAKGHFRKDGICVPAKECPRKCKDPNATWKDCPNGPDPCPATCQHTVPTPCELACKSGCQCNEGYVLSVPDGICVKVETCKDHANCGTNKTFVECTFRCPNVLCPENDLTILCKPPRDCPGGCGCLPNYRYNSEDRCILASECPPVECTRQNEVWDPCSSEDLIEECSYRLNEPYSTSEDHICYPRCVCIDKHYRNDQQLCVPECECP